MKNLLTVRYTNGDEEKFEFEGRATTASTPLVLKDFLNRPIIALQIKDEIVVIPPHNVQSFSVKRRGEAEPIDGVLQAKRK